MMGVNLSGAACIIENRRYFAVFVRQSDYLASEFYKNYTHSKGKNTVCNNSFSTYEPIILLSTYITETAYLNT